MLSLLGCKMSPWGNFCFKLCVINHDHNAKVPQSVYGSCKHSYYIPECFSSLNWVWCLSWGVGESLPGVCEKAPFLFSCKSASVGIETADLQMQHINVEETYKLGTKSNTCCNEGSSEKRYEWSVLCSTYDRRSPWWKKWGEKIAWRQRQAWLTTIFL